MILFCLYPNKTFSFVYFCKYLMSENFANFFKLLRRNDMLFYIKKKKRMTQYTPRMFHFFVERTIKNKIAVLSCRQ